MMDPKASVCWRLGVLLWAAFLSLLPWCGIFHLPPLGLPKALVVTNPPTNARDIRDESTIPGSGRSPAKGNGNPLQYSSLGNPMERGAWRATVHGVAKGRTWVSGSAQHSNFIVRLPRWLSGKEPTCQCGWVGSLGWEDPLEKEMATHSSILAWEISWQRSLAGYCPCGCKSWMWLSDWTTTTNLNISQERSIWMNGRAKFQSRISWDGSVTCPWRYPCQGCRLKASYRGTLSPRCTVFVEFLPLR